MIGDYWHATDFQRQILGIKVDNSQMISLESDPCHLQSKVYRGFNCNQNWSLDTAKVFVRLTVNGLCATVCLTYKFFKTSLLTSKGEKDSFGDKVIYLKLKFYDNCK